MNYPPLYVVRQKFDDTALADPDQLAAQLAAEHLARAGVGAGQRVAVTSGSRGIHAMTDITAAVVRAAADLGAKPFIIPAMGSHGGATGPGQAGILADLGITEAAMGCPIVATMDTTVLGRLASGAEVHFSTDALGADHIVVINRVKPHTAFRGRVESGLAKMLAVGLGRQKGASTIHRYGLAETVIPAAEMILQKTPVTLGLALVDNALGLTRTLEATGPEDLIETDARLLKEAWQHLPLVPVDRLDALVVDRMGKNISGAGLDPNVIGFWRREGGPRQPDYRIVTVHDLTDQSHGNAVGVGMTDLIPKRLAQKIDPVPTAMNAITSGILASSRIPVTLDNDRAIIDTLMSLVPDPARIRLARIRDTKSLDRFWVTEAVREELADRPELEVDSQPLALSFDDSGNLRAM